MAMTSVDQKCTVCGFFRSLSGNRCDFCTLWQVSIPRGGLGLSDDKAREATLLFRDFCIARHPDARELRVWNGYAESLVARCRKNEEDILEWLRDALKDYPQCCLCDQHLPKNQKRPTCDKHKPWFAELERRCNGRFPDGTDIPSLARTFGPKWKESFDGTIGMTDETAWGMFMSDVIEPDMEKEWKKKGRRPAAPKPSLPSKPTPLPPLTSSPPKPAVASPALPVSPPPKPTGAPPPRSVDVDAAMPPAPPGPKIPAEPVVMSKLPKLGRKWTDGEKQWVWKNGEEIAKLLSNPTPEEFSAIFFWRDEHFKKCGVSGHKARAAGVEFLNELLPRVVVPKILAVRAAVSSVPVSSSGAPPTPVAKPAEATPPKPFDSSATGGSAQGIIVPEPARPAEAERGWVEGRGQSSSIDASAEVNVAFEILLGKIQGLASQAQGIVEEIHKLEARLVALRDEASKKK